MKDTDLKKYERYTRFENGVAMSYELEQPEYVAKVNFNRSNQAIKFLKTYSKDEEFEFEVATPALLKAIEYLEEFETELKETMIKGIAEEERKKEAASIAHGKADKIIETKIKPQFEKLLSDIQILNDIENYSPAWFRYDLEGFVNQFKTALRV